MQGGAAQIGRSQPGPPSVPIHTRWRAAETVMPKPSWCGSPDRLPAPYRRFDLIPQTGRSTLYDCPAPVGPRCGPRLRTGGHVPEDLFGRHSHPLGRRRGELGNPASGPGVDDLGIDPARALLTGQQGQRRAGWAIVRAARLHLVQPRHGDVPDRAGGDQAVVRDPVRISPQTVPDDQPGSVPGCLDGGGRGAADHRVVLNARDPVGRRVAATCAAPVTAAWTTTRVNPQRLFRLRPHRA